MLIFKLAWRNIIRNAKKSLLLATLIMVGIAILFIGNALFLGTNEGLERTFVGSFTGDAAIGPDSNGAFSLLGNEIPFINNLEVIPPLYSHDSIVENIKNLSAVSSFTSIVFTPVRVEIGKFKQNSLLYGVEPAGYLDICSEIEIEFGDFSDLKQDGVFLNSEMARNIEETIGRKLIPGELIRFSVSSGSSFRLKSSPLLGVYNYAGSATALDLVILADLTSVRYLADYTLGKTSSENPIDVVSDDDFDLNTLFAEEGDVVADSSEELNLEGLESSLTDTQVRDSLIETDSGAWSFILVKADEGNRKFLYRQIKKLLRNYSEEAEFLSWRRAAGTSALIVFAVQTLFYISLGFLGLGAVLVIMNALVFSVLERTGEIGTMRSMGASQSFIRYLFMWESMIISMGGALIGILMGVLAVFIIEKISPELTNQLIISLFGGTKLSPHFNLSSICIHLVIAAIIGSFAWIYPVSLAMKIEPITAINKG